MAIGLGLCSTHAPGTYQDTLRGWDLNNRVRANARPARPLGPPPPEIEEENSERVEFDFAPRAKAGYEALRKQLAAYDPDALIIVGGDQTEWFDASNMPSIMVYAGEDDLWGVHKVGADDDGLDPAEHHDRFRMDLKVDRELARQLLDGLVKREGFDVAISTRMELLSRPKRGLPHAFVDPAPWLLHRPDLPIVPVFIMTTENTPAILTGERCLALGRAIARVCETSNKRIAIYGSGGLSHGPRRGWVDDPMDHWFLQQLSSGNTESLKSMFSYQSANTMAGTGEDRTWIVVAGAMDQVKPGHQAQVVDYFPARKNITGCGWLYYPAVTGAKELRSAARATEAARG